MTTATTRALGRGGQRAAADLLEECKLNHYYCALALFGSRRLSQWPASRTGPSLSVSRWAHSLAGPIIGQLKKLALGAGALVGRASGRADKNGVC